MTLYEYLSKFPEPEPAWITRHVKGDGFNRGDFFASRTVFYPGSGTDGHPVKVFGSTRSAHTFIYTDYILDQSVIEHELADAIYGFRGYHSIDRIMLESTDLAPNGWIPHIQVKPRNRLRGMDSTFRPYGFIEIIERDPERPESYGSKRLAIMFLGTDAVAAFDALYCQQGNTSNPFALLLQDHAFGGGYTSFGQNGLLAKLANVTSKYPKFLLVADYTDAWDGYAIIPDLQGDRGGMHHNLRHLYIKSIQEGSDDMNPSSS